MTTRNRVTPLIVIYGITRHCDVMSGAPCVAGTRIPVFMLAARFWHGESIEEIADDYHLEVKDVEPAIRFELIRRTRRFSVHSQYAHKEPRKNQGEWKP